METRSDRLRKMYQDKDIPLLLWNIRDTAEAMYYRDILQTGHLDNRFNEYVEELFILTEILKTKIGI